MNDRELLELAAKAAGMTGWAYKGLSGMHKLIDPSRPETTGSIGPAWNPLTDDGDALRLAAKLKIDIEWQNVGDFPEPSVEAYRRGRDGETTFCPSEHEDNYRVAITRAAAEIAHDTEKRHG